MNSGRTSTSILKKNKLLLIIIFISVTLRLWHNQCFFLLIIKELNSIILILIFILSLHFSPNMSAVSVLWTLLSVVGLFTSSLALFSPFWHEHIPDENLANSNKSFIAFGLLRFCLQDQFVTLQDINEFKDSKDCSFYKGLFSGIPSVFWKVAAIIYTTAILLQVVALLLAHIFCCQKFVCGKVITKVAAFIQSIAGKDYSFWSIFISSIKRAASHGHARPLPGHNKFYFLPLHEIFNVPPKNCETEPTVYCPYTRRLERLVTICRCHYKGSTFSSVILRPWVMVRPGIWTHDLPHSSSQLY